MTYCDDDAVPCFLSSLLTKGYSPIVKSCTRSMAQGGTPDVISDSFTSLLSALLIALITSLCMMHRSIVYAAISMACECSAFCGGGVGAGVAGTEDLPKSEAKEEERREVLV